MQKLSPFFFRKKEKKNFKLKGLFRIFCKLFVGTRYNAICNECIPFYSNLRYKFRLNCFTNDMSRVFSTPHYEIIDDIENVFVEAFRWQQEKSYTYWNWKFSFRSLANLKLWRRCRTGFSIGNLCDYFIFCD